MTLIVKNETNSIYKEDIGLTFSKQEIANTFINYLLSTFYLTNISPEVEISCLNSKFGEIKKYMWPFYAFLRKA